MEQLAKFCRDNIDKWVKIPIYNSNIRPSDVVNVFGFTNLINVNAIIEATKSKSTLCIKYALDKQYALGYLSIDFYNESALDFYSAIEEYGEL